ncbi:MAG: sigma-54 dependent transcriptional regulator [Myxococcota bacterium]|nr:sigma-54 dependent transcriptional regulator [Myxococcota bacterium]
MTSKTQPQRHVLIIDDDELVREQLTSLIAADGFRVSTNPGTYDVVDQAFDIDPDLILVDFRLPHTSGIDLLGQLRDRGISAPALIMTAYADTDLALEAIRFGAFDFLSKPLDPLRLKICLERAWAMRSIAEENRELRSGRPPATQLGDATGVSKAMQEVFSIARRVAGSKSTVLITGESGTGKEVIARALHDQGSRANETFVGINCSSLPEHLLESELFGHVRGAFTGATTHKEGLFVTAGQGTIFLDEVGDMPEALQAKLLRVLQEREVRPVGSTVSVPVRARIVAATNADLQTAMVKGRFRKDLFYRLNVIPIYLPPLRERAEDIGALAHLFLERHGNGDRHFSREAVEILSKKPWPGNARELENFIERILTLTDALLIGREDLEKVADPIVGIPTDENSIDELLNAAFRMDLSIQALNDRYIETVLQKVDGCKTVASQILGIHRTTLYRRPAA